MKDYRIQISVKNNYLRTRMESAGFYGGSELARVSGVSQTDISAYMTLRRAPLGAKGWRKSALDLAIFLSCEPEDLFPPQHIEKALPKNRIEIEASLDDVKLLANTLNQERNLLDRDAIEYALEDLRPREKEILLSIEVEGRTFREVGQTHGISGNRVRQIAMMAKRKMRTRLVKTVGGKENVAKDLYCR